MGKTLETIDKSDFSDLIGETFLIGDYETELIAVRDGSETPPRFRDAFTLTFRTPDDCDIMSDVLRVSHPAIGTHELLCVQVTGWDAPTHLEINFN